MVAKHQEATQVEVQLPNLNIKLDGSLLSADPQKFVVLLDEAFSDSWHQIRGGATIFLFIRAKEMLYRIQAQVAQINLPVIVCLLSSPPALIDRRSEKRYVVSMITHITADDTVLEARITNISRSGVRIVLSRALAIGTPTSLTFPVLDGAHEISAKGEVRYCIPAEDKSRWFHGVQFTDLTRTDALWLAKLFP